MQALVHRDREVKIVDGKELYLRSLESRAPKISGVRIVEAYGSANARLHMLGEFAIGFLCKR